MAVNLVTPRGFTIPQNLVPTTPSPAPAPASQSYGVSFVPYRNVWRSQTVTVRPNVGVSIPP
jgi:hypothetical protein